MKRYLLLALLLPLAVSAQDDLFDYSSLSLGVSLENTFSIRQDKDLLLDSVQATMLWYPSDDYRQTVDQINTEPKSSFSEGEGFTFSWTKPDVLSYRIRQDSKVLTRNGFVSVKAKIAFPIVDLDPSLSTYLNSQEIIIINDDIKNLAAGLVHDETDLYKAVAKLADWVERNVNYSLSSITADASQTSAWVLENKKGVCDELTSLFIAMSRSVGIPARFVSGLSYSNVGLQNDGWGPHGWAEVYFPGVGWIPFDVTYKQLGFVDATHVKLKTSVDAKESSVEYQSYGRGAKIIPGSLDFDVRVIGHGAVDEPDIDFAIKVAQGQVGFESYNLVVLTASNPTDEYRTTRATLAQVKSLRSLSDASKTVVLAPRETKSFYWLLEVDKLDSDYIYTFPIKILGDLGEQAESSFKVSRKFKTYSESYMRSQMDSEPESIISNVLLGCNGDLSIYLDEKALLDCYVQSQSPIAIQLRVCLESECSVERFDPLQRKEFSYELGFDSLGVKTLPFSAKGSVSGSYFVVIDVKDEPLVDVVNLTHASSLRFGEDSEIAFLFSRKSASAPKNITVELHHEFLNEKWTFASLESDYQIRFLFNAENLDVGVNDFELLIRYYDDEGQAYSLERTFTIALEDPTLLQRLRIMLFKVDNWLGRVFGGIMQKV